MNPTWQKFMDALPASGMIPHSDFLVQLTQQGDASVNGEINRLRRAGLVAVELREIDGVKVPYVGKVVVDASE